MAPARARPRPPRPALTQVRTQRGQQQGHQHWPHGGASAEGPGAGERAALYSGRRGGPSNLPGHELGEQGHLAGAPGCPRPRGPSLPATTPTPTPSLSLRALAPALASMGLGSKKQAQAGGRGAGVGRRPVNPKVRFGSQSGHRPGSGLAPQ